MVAEVAFVDQREERECRLIRPAATGLRVDVAEEVPGEREVVAEHPFVKQRKRLELVHPDRPVAVDAARAPLDAARHEEVRRQVDSVLDAGVEESVQLRHLLGEKRRPVLRVAQRALVVVDSERVVPHAREACAERVGLVVGEVVCREAEIASVEALGDARLPLELEMRPLRNDASVLAGRRVHPTKLREVERGAGRDVSRIVQRHPLRRTRDDEWPADDAVDPVGRVEGHLDATAFPGLELRTTDPHAEREVLSAPLAVVLNHHRRVFRERKRKHLALRVAHPHLTTRCVADPRLAAERRRKRELSFPETHLSAAEAGRRQRQRDAECR